jgi:hypothetical protein
MNSKISASAILLILLIALSFSCKTNKQKEKKETAAVSVWSTEKAKEWAKNLPWLRGSDFIPSTAINQLEMWQAETFDTATINRELGWAENIGFNCMRVYLHHLAWETDSTGFKNRINKYLSIAADHDIKTIFVIFDDCWNPTYKAGKQPDPKPGVHNSGWVRDPGELIYTNPAIANTLERYVKDLLRTFSSDTRILAWDLYNEPGNSSHGRNSMPLLKAVFKWGREINPSQPLTCGIWDGTLKEFNSFQAGNSDIISYHNY